MRAAPPEWPGRRPPDILVLEVISGDRRTTPWLGRTGLVVTGVLFALGIAISTAITESMWPYTATAGQFAGAGIAVAVLVAAGLLLRPRLRARPGVAPGARTVLVATLIAGAVFQGSTLIGPPTWAGVTAWVLVVVVFLALVRLWSAREGWGDRQRLAIGAGLLLTYAWHSFAETPVGGATAVAIDLTGNAVFTAGALALLWFAGRRATRPAPAETTVSA